VELSNLPHLETLHLTIVSLSLIENFPIQMKLKNLKKLVFEIESAVTLSISSRFITWMTTQLPSLEVLEYDLEALENSSEIKNDVSFNIDSLRTNDVYIHNSLKHLILCNCPMKKESFEILMLEIVPKLRNFTSLDLYGSNIESFLPIVDSIKNDRTFVPSKSLYSIR
jgi:hypothetical protein